MWCTTAPFVNHWTEMIRLLGWRVGKLEASACICRELCGHLILLEPEAPLARLRKNRGATRRGKTSRHHNTSRNVNRNDKSGKQQHHQRPSNQLKATWQKRPWRSSSWKPNDPRQDPSYSLKTKQLSASGRGPKGPDKRQSPQRPGQITSHTERRWESNTWFEVDSLQET